MCEMHIRTTNFEIVLKDRLRLPDQPIAQSSREGPTVPV
jgi:hypothetical protein